MLSNRYLGFVVKAIYIVIKKKHSRVFGEVFLELKMFVQVV